MKAFFTFLGLVILSLPADGLQTISAFGSSLEIDEYGGSSMATAETSRILVEALLKDFPLSGGNVKKHLQNGVDHKSDLLGKVSVPGVLNQRLFEESLQTEKSD